MGIVLFGVSVADEPSTAETSNKTRRLDQMLERAKRASIRIIGPDLDSDSKDQPQSVELLPQPLFRYDDQPRGFRDGTLWIWTDKGRPVAIEKVEDWRDATRSPTWITCLTSVSPRMIRATWEGGYDWNSKKPGIEFRSLKDGPQPEANEAGRLRQFKELLRHFSVSMQLYTGDRQELRLLPRQLHRYQIPSEHVTDSVIFGWTAGRIPMRYCSLNCTQLPGRHRNGSIRSPRSPQTNCGSNVTKSSSKPKIKRSSQVTTR